MGVVAFKMRSPISLRSLSGNALSRPLFKSVTKICDISYAEPAGTIRRNRPRKAAYLEPPSAAQKLYERLRAEFLVAVNTLPSPSSLEVRVRDFEMVDPNEEGEPPFDNFVQSYFGQPCSLRQPLPVFNSIFKEVYVQITSQPEWYRISELQKLSNWVHQSQQQLREFGVSEQIINDMLIAIAGDDTWAFLQTCLRR